MNLFVLLPLFSPLSCIGFIILIYRVNVSENEINKTIKYYSILSLIWSLILFGISFLFLLHYAEEENRFIIIVFSFQYLLITAILICSLIFRKDKIPFLTSAAFLLIISFVPYILSLISYQSGDDAPVMALILFFGFPMIASMVSGMRIFLYTRKIMEKLN